MGQLKHGGGKNHGGYDTNKTWGYGTNKHGTITCRRYGMGTNTVTKGSESELLQNPSHGTSSRRLEFELRRVPGAENPGVEEEEENPGGVPASM